jgi:hypothetical protein
MNGSKHRLPKTGPVRTGLVRAGLVSAGLLAAALAGALDGGVYTPAGVALHSTLRQLWEEHVLYTRTFIISSLAGLPDAGSAAQRLLRNQDDLGAAIRPFYGEAAGAGLARLLREHILVAADVVQAARAGDGGALGSGQAAWQANAREIAAFLAGANAHWPEAALRHMLYMHLDYTTAEVVARLKGDWAADIEAYDQGRRHMLELSDMLADGIVKQFPERFRP